MRPCTCDNLTMGQPYTSDQCRLCWLYHHDPAYRQAWGGPAMPGLLARAGNFLGAALGHLAAGLPRTSPAETARRLAMCLTCPFLVGERCGKCACPVAAKAAWKEQRCPIDRW